jgi:oligopeptide transport system ATP-binding protein
MIEVRDLTVDHPLKRGRVTAVDGVSFDIHPGQTLAIVGESGCGKTTLGRAMLRLVPASRGVVRFNGVDVMTLTPAALREQRRHMQMIFQHPAASLDPRLTIAQIVREPIDSFGLSEKIAAPERVREMLDTVGLSDRLLPRYPHELSGGQQQRVAIARALAADPSFIVADEPLSALDVSIQAQIINLLRALQRDRQLTYLFISHDLRAVRHIAHHVAVMYLGKIVEMAETSELYRRPLIPYTQELMSASTTVGRPREEGATATAR